MLCFIFRDLYSMYICDLALSHNIIFQARLLLVSNIPGKGLKVKQVLHTLCEMLMHIWT